MDDNNDGQGTTMTTTTKITHQSNSALERGREEMTVVATNDG